MLTTTTLMLIEHTKLREAMDAAGLSTRKLAAVSGCSPARVAQMAVGQFPSTSAITAVAMAAALDVEVRDLFTFPDGETLVRLGLIRSV
jgi:transcriptional regulator with XRE-family HTH domain